MPRIPRVLPDGRASTIFDEFLINLSGVVRGLPPGILLVSGDVLLVFDHLQLSFQRRGVTGVSVATNAEMGTRHGVYVSSPDSRDVSAFLHKPSADILAQWQAMDESGKVQIDTGLVWFDAPTALRFAQLAENAQIAHLCGLENPRADAAHPSPLNLYGDLLLPLAEGTQFADYLSDSSDGPATPALQSARRVIWDQVRGVRFSVERLQPAVFVHFGTSEEYWQMLAADRQLADICDWTRHASSWLSDAEATRGDAFVLVNTAVDKSAHNLETDEDASLQAKSSNAELSVTHEPLLAVDSYLGAGIAWKGRSIVAGVHTQEPLVLQGEYVLHQLAVNDGYVTRLFGLMDDPKHPKDDPAATYLNRAWHHWLKELDEPPQLLWPDLPPEQWTLWTAHIFPFSPDRAESLQLALPLQHPRSAPPGWKPRWKSSERFSLAQSFAHADGQRLLSEMTGLEDLVAAKQFYAAVQNEQPALTTAAWLGSLGSNIALRRGALVESWLEDAGPELKMRGWKALAVAIGDSGFEDRAFDVLAREIETDVVQRQARYRTQSASTSAFEQEAHVRVAVAARIDFGGGWTDTPPYSIERGGTVLNAAILLHDRHPIVAEAARTAEPGLVLESRDINDVFIPESVGEVLAYRNPADPFALLKAALVVKGVVPVDCRPDMPISTLLGNGQGLRLTTQTHIPAGRGWAQVRLWPGQFWPAWTICSGSKVHQTNCSTKCSAWNRC